MVTVMRRTFGGTLLLALVAGLFTFATPARAGAPFSLAGLKAKSAKATASVKPGNVKKLTVQCPDKLRVVSGGAWFHRKNQGGDPSIAGFAWLLSTFRKEHGWTAIGLVNGSATESYVFEVNVLCSPRKLRDNTHATSTAVANGTPIDHSGSCVSGQVFSQTAWWSDEAFGDPIQEFAARIVGNSPTSASATYFMGVNFSGRELYFNSETICSDDLATLSIVSETNDGTDAGPPDTRRRSVPICSAGRAVNGGSYFHPYGLPANPALAGQLLLGSSSFTTNRSGWFAYGDAYEQAGQDIRMTASALCLA